MNILYYLHTFLLLASVFIQNIECIKSRTQSINALKEKYLLSDIYHIELISQLNSTELKYIQETLSNNLSSKNVKVNVNVLKPSVIKSNNEIRFLLLYKDNILYDKLLNLNIDLQSVLNIITAEITKAIDENKNFDNIIKTKPSLLHKLTSYNATFDEIKNKLNPEEINSHTPKTNPTSFILIKQTLESDYSGKGKRLFFTILLTVVLLGLILILIKYSLKYAETIRMDVEKIRLKNNFEVLKELSEKSVAIKNLLNKNN